MLTRPSSVLRRRIDSRETSIWQSAPLASPTKTLNRDAVPIGDDIEPAEESRVDVKTGNEEEEEPLEAEIPRVRLNPKNPTSREKQ